MKKLGRYKRHIRIRKKIFGDSQKPRLSVFRSSKNMQAQIVNDIEQKVILAVTTTSKEFKNEFKSGSNIKAAEKLGEVLAKKAKERGIERVKFDRSGFMYHGRIKAFAEAARKNGLKF
jgi:large subunit ribosomal protein L18